MGTVYHFMLCLYRSHFSILQPYYDQANELIQQYQNALQEWEQAMFDEGHLDLIRVSTLRTLLPKAKKSKSKTSGKAKSKKSKSKTSGKAKSKKSKDDASGKNQPQGWMREE